MAAAVESRCVTDGEIATLRCSSCDAPICPKCLTRAEVGFRCPKCVEAPATVRRPRRKGLLVGAVAVVVAVVAVVVVIAVSGGSPAPKVPGVGASGYLTVERPTLGFSITIPKSWVQDVDPTPGSVFYAKSAPLVSWVRVFRGDTSVPLSASVPSLISGLQAQGAQNFVQTSTQLDGMPAIRIDYLQADGPVAGALIPHTSYQLLVNGSVHFSLTLVTTRPADQNAVLDQIAAGFRFT